jgi:acetyl-CoA carboxylase carboxyl transferase subunit alpha
VTVPAAPDAWETVERARHPERPYSRDYILRLAPDFVELHGDRLTGDDPALVAGLGTWNGLTTLFMGQQKGRRLDERVHRNFGMMHPEGFRKATRLAKQAARFGFPIVCLVDTPGAFPGAGAEERGIASAIAISIAGWFSVGTPVLAAIIGEGGSGGALGLSVSDRLLMLESAIFSVASPESAAAIVWRDQANKRKAAEQLRLTSSDLLRMGLVDEIVPEPAGGAHTDHDAAARHLDESLTRALDEVRHLPPDILLRRRHQRARAVGTERSNGRAIGADRR